MPERMFWYTLAGHLGMTVKECMSKVSADEFKMWWAYNKLSPIGLERFDFLFSMVCLILAQANAKKGKSFTIDDFMPKWGESSKKVSPENAETYLLNYAKVYNNFHRNKNKK